MSCMGYLALVTGILTAALASTATPVPAAGAIPALAVARPVQGATQSRGRMSFTVNGAAKVFDRLPDGDNNYTPLGSTIKATAAAGTREQLSITFLSIDLKKQQYPGELPPPRGRGPGVNPLTAMASVGFSYIDADGREWAGPGRVSVEAFGSDGVIVGTFSNVSLPHTEKARPNVTLAEGTFRARISAPW